jgi:hypothetical protein
VTSPPSESREWPLRSWRPGGATAAPLRLPDEARRAVAPGVENQGLRWPLSRAEVEEHSMHWRSQTRGRHDERPESARPTTATPTTTLAVRLGPPPRARSTSDGMQLGPHHDMRRRRSRFEDRSGQLRRMRPSLRQQLCLSGRCLRLPRDPLRRELHRPPNRSEPLRRMRQCLQRQPGVQGRQLRLRWGTLWRELRRPPGGSGQLRIMRQRLRARTSVRERRLRMRVRKRLLARLRVPSAVDALLRRYGSALPFFQ